MFDKVNLERALARIRARENRRKANAVLEEFKSLFEADWEWERRISHTLNSGAVSAHLPDPDAFDERRIYSREAIRSLCLKYKLRFLSSSYFKGKIPHAALAAVKEAEKTCGSSIDAFMMVAPAAMFKLEDANKDPLLFAPLSDGRYYLLHQWGNDLSGFRRVLAWPSKNPLRLLGSIFMIALLLTVVVPADLLSESGSWFNFYRLALLAWNLVFISALTSYFWFALHQRFGVESWNSPHFND